jgi:hypothetical protein
MQPAAPKKRDNDLPIRRATGRRPAVHDVDFFRIPLPRRPLPEDLPGIAIDANHYPLAPLFKR